MPVPYDNLIICQLFKPIEILTGVEMRNKYRIIDLGRRDILFASEESGFVKRQRFGFRCPLTLKGLDMEGNLHLKAERGTPMANAFLTLMHRMGHDEAERPAEAATGCEPSSGAIWIQGDRLAGRGTAPEHRLVQAEGPEPISRRSAPPTSAAS